MLAHSLKGNFKERRRLMEVYEKPGVENESNKCEILECCMWTV